MDSGSGADQSMSATYTPLQSGVTFITSGFCKRLVVSIISQPTLYILTLVIRLTSCQSVLHGYSTDEAAVVDVEMPKGGQAHVS
jgi:hypothetical protein